MGSSFHRLNFHVSKIDHLLYPGVLVHNTYVCRMLESTGKKTQTCHLENCNFQNFYPEENVVYGPEYCICCDNPRFNNIIKGAMSLMRLYHKMAQRKLLSWTLICIVLHLVLVSIRQINATYISKVRCKCDLYKRKGKRYITW